MLEPLTPTLTAELLGPLHRELVTLLRSLGGDDWTRSTVAGTWTVKDVAGHLLDGGLRRLSGPRDGHQLTTQPVSSYADVLGLINALNAGGISYTARLSPRLLTDLIEVTGVWVAEYLASLPPHSDAAFAVDWAGEGRSEHWMDAGREYTEHWHHQMQIRAAVGAPGLLERRWLLPLLEMSVRAFPRTYSGVEAREGTAVTFDVRTADCGYAWSVVRDTEGWQVWRGRADAPAASLVTDGDTAWRLLYNAPADAAALALSGDRSLLGPMLGTRSVMV